MPPPIATGATAAPTRRRLLVTGVAGSAAVALGGCSPGSGRGPSGQPSGPATRTDTAATPTGGPPLAALSSVPAHDALAVTDPAGGPGFLLRDGSTVRYLSAVCSHGGCNVDWDHTKGRFVCPCHLSEFDRTGHVLNPPAPGPLGSRAVVVVDGQVRLG